MTEKKIVEFAIWVDPNKAADTEPSHLHWSLNSQYHRDCMECYFKYCRHKFCCPLFLGLKLEKEEMLFL